MPLRPSPSSFEIPCSTFEIPFPSFSTFLSLYLRVALTPWFKTPDSRLQTPDYRLKKEAHYRPLFLHHFTSHFNNNEVPKLTTAPMKASRVVFITSPGISCSSTSSVPPTVPALVLPSGFIVFRSGRCAFLRSGLANGHGYTACYCQVGSQLHHHGR